MLQQPVCQHVTALHCIWQAGDNYASMLQYDVTRYLNVDLELERCPDICCFGGLVVVVIIARSRMITAPAKQHLQMAATSNDPKLSVSFGDLLLLQDLPESTDELEREIKLLTSWLQTTQHLLGLKCTAAAANQEEMPSSGSKASRHAKAVSRSSKVQPHSQQTFPQAVVHQSCKSQTGLHDTPAVEHSLEIGTSRSVGAIDDALRAQGFR